MAKLKCVCASAQLTLQKRVQKRENFLFTVNLLNLTSEASVEGAPALALTTLRGFSGRAASRMYADRAAASKKLVDELISGRG